MQDPPPPHIKATFVIFGRSPIHFFLFESGHNFLQLLTPTLRQARRFWPLKRVRTGGEAACIFATAPHPLGCEQGVCWSGAEQGPAGWRLVPPNSLVCQLTQVGVPVPDASCPSGGLPWLLGLLGQSNSGRLEAHAPNGPVVAGGRLPGHELGLPVPGAVWVHVPLVTRGLWGNFPCHWQMPGVCVF